MECNSYPITPRLPFQGLGKDVRHSSPSHQTRKATASESLASHMAAGTTALSLVQPQHLSVL